MPEFFFETTASRRQIGCIHQRDGSRLQTLAAQQSFHQVTVDIAQPAHSHLLTKLMEHSHGGVNTAQSGKTSPRRLF